MLVRDPPSEVAAVVAVSVDMVELTEVPESRRRSPGGGVWLRFWDGAWLWEEEEDKRLLLLLFLGRSKASLSA